MLANDENHHNLVPGDGDEDEENLTPGGDNNGDAVPLELVELNTIAGHVSSIGGGDMIMAGPEEDYEYLPGWGGGRNGTVAPSLPRVPEEPNFRTNDDAGIAETLAEHRILTVTLKIPCRIVPLLLATNLACALVLQGFSNFYHVTCGKFLAHAKPDASFVNATLPSGCLPLGWHRDYLQEFPPTHQANRYPYEAIYRDAYSQQHRDVNNYLSKVQTVSTILLLASAAALMNIGLLAMSKSSTCCYCCRPRCFFPTLGLCLRVLSCLALATWGTVATLLHLVDIWVYGRLWWLVVLIALIALELWQMVLYETYRRHEILPRFATLTTNMNHDGGAGQNAPLLDPEANAGNRARHVDVEYDV